MNMEKTINENTFTKKIGRTVYVVHYYFNEDAKETMQEKINRMLVNEAIHDGLSEIKFDN